MAFKGPKPRPKRAPRFSTPKHAPSTSKNRGSLGNSVSEELTVSEELSIEECLTVINKSKYPELNKIANKIQTYAQTNNLSLDSLASQKLSIFLKQSSVVGYLLKEMEKVLLDIDPTYLPQLKDSRLSLSDFFNIVAKHVKLFPETKLTDLKEILKLKKEIDFEILETIEDLTTNTLYKFYKKAERDGTQMIDPRNFETFLEFFKENKSTKKTSNKNILKQKPTKEMIELGEVLYYQVALMILVDENMMKNPAKLVKDFIKAYKGSKI